MLEKLSFHVFADDTQLPRSFLSEDTNEVFASASWSDAEILAYIFFFLRHGVFFSEAIKLCALSTPRNLYSIFIQFFFAKPWLRNLSRAKASRNANLKFMEVCSEAIKLCTLPIPENPFVLNLYLFFLCQNLIPKFETKKILLYSMFIYFFFAKPRFWNFSQSESQKNANLKFFGCFFWSHQSLRIVNSRKSTCIQYLFIFPLRDPDSEIRVQQNPEEM